MRRALLAVLPLLAGCAQPVDQAAAVDALFADYANTAGAAVAVVREGKTVLIKGYGLADVDKRTRIGASTVFDLASLSKPLTAMAVLMLVQDGKVGLDDPLGKTFSEFPADARKITVRHLLNHTAGLPDYMDLLVQSGRIPLPTPKSSRGERAKYEPTTKDIVDLLAKQPKLEFEPGTKHAYSNSGYVVLAHLVERVSGQRFADFMKARLFEPAGMKSAIVADERRLPIPNRAHSYLTKSAREDSDYTPLNLIYGDGNVNATVADMAAFAAALQSEKLLPGKALDQAWSPAKLMSGSVSDYGFGWVIGQWGDDLAVGHEGAWAGFRSSMIHVPKRRLTVIVLSNLAEMPVGVLTVKILELYSGN